MSIEQQRTIVRNQRKLLITELEEVYLQAFNRLPSLSLNEATLGRLAQLILTSKESAIQALETEIEAPLITKAETSLD